MAGEPYDTTRVLTIPNLLSFLRLLGVPFFLWLLISGDTADYWAVVLLAVAGGTDWLDGYLARTWGQRSRLGQVLDPMADRLYILAILIGFVARGIVPWWLLVVLASRDIILAATLGPPLRRRGYASLPVHFLGKAATFLLLYSFPLVLLGEGAASWQVAARTLGWALVIWGTVLYWWSGALYLKQGFDLARREPLAPRSAALT